MLDPVALTVALAVLVGGGFLVGFILKGVALAERKGDALRRFAERHRLHYEKKGQHGEMRGDVDGREFLLHRKKVGDDTRVWAAELEVPGPLPEGLLFAPEMVHAGWAKKLVHGEDLGVGAREFDEAVIVQADEPPLLEAYLTPERRRAVLDLVEMEGKLEEGRLVVFNPKGVADLRAMEEMLRRLRGISDALRVRRNEPCAAALAASRRHGEHVRATA